MRFLAITGLAAGFMLLGFAVGLGISGNPTAAYKTITLGGALLAMGFACACLYVGGN